MIVDEKSLRYFRTDELMLEMFKVSSLSMHLAACLMRRLLACY